MDDPIRFRWGHLGIAVTFVLVAAAVGISYWFSRGGAPVAREAPKEVPPYRPEPVPTNRASDVTKGFRGDTHPELHGKTQLTLTAHWSPLGKGRDQLDRTVPPDVYRLYSDFKPAADRQTYTERDFFGLLPQSVGPVGQVWEIDLDAAARLLRQFHPRPNMHLVAFGRRAGPDGAFGVLRGMSATHLDIALRIHAEFDLAQNVWLTPACFLGRMIVDRKAGTVESFRLWVPPDNPLNVHLTVAESIPKGGSKREVFRTIERGDLVDSKHDIVRVEQMELASESASTAKAVDGPEAMSEELADQTLKKAFYAFAEIDWVPWDQALALARQRNRKVFAIVLWGALDDQSC